MRMIKVTDYITEFLIEKGIRHTFGYPGGSAANLINSFYTYKDHISAHVTYNEQGAAFAACGYAQMAGVPGVAYSIGGPGATNLLTGIGHAWFDSIPLICLTGNVNTYESSSNMKVRQRAFQECDIIPVVSSLTKYCAYVDKPEDIRFHLEKAFFSSTNGRMGPVLLDLPMDVTRAMIDSDSLSRFEGEDDPVYDSSEAFASVICEAFENADRPLLILGNGVKAPKYRSMLEKLVSHLGIPYVTSMIAFDILQDNPLGYGFLGASGSRSANFIAAKSDLIISIGSRLDIRQVGAKREQFASNARIIRIDIDRDELEYKLHTDEVSFCMEAADAIDVLLNTELKSDYAPWREVCEIIRHKTGGMDIRTPNALMMAVSDEVPEGATVTTDVGQNQVWTAQNFRLKRDQKVLFSGGFGSMGHALPSAIGAHYATGGTAVAIAGDGGIQMNIQELQFIARERIPIKIVVFNNHALGMIRHFQEVWFDGVFYQTKPEGGFTSPSFCKIAEAYGIDSMEIHDLDDIKKIHEKMSNDEPVLFEVQINEDTYEYPKLKFGSPNQDQEPLMDRDLFEELMSL